jgi:hypothetical protein
MDLEKLLGTVKMYLAMMEYVDANRVPGDRKPRPSEILPHCKWMLNQIPDHVEAGQMEKANRWLGFVQACLWANGTFTIDQMKDHNR